MIILSIFKCTFSGIRYIHIIVQPSPLSISRIFNCSCCSVAQLCPTLCDLMDCSTPGFPILHYLPEFARTRVHLVRVPFNHLILCHHILLLPSVFPIIRLFSNKSALWIMWLKYLSFSISPSNEYSGLISLGLTGLISLLSKGLSRVFSNTTVQKHQFFSAQLPL